MGPTQNHVKDVLDYFFSRNCVTLDAMRAHILPYMENRSLSGLLIGNEVFVSTLEIYKTSKIFSYLLYSIQQNRHWRQTSHKAD